MYRAFSSSLAALFVAGTLLATTPAMAMSNTELLGAAHRNLDSAKQELSAANDPKSVLHGNFKSAIDDASNAIDQADLAAKQGAARTDTAPLVSEATAVQTQAIDGYFASTDAQAAGFQKAGNRSEVGNALDRLAGALHNAKRSKDPRLAPLVAKYKCTFWSTTGDNAFNGVKCE